jgi:hypothetical protein
MSMNSSLDFFSTPPISTAEEGSYMMKVSPVTSIDNNVNINYDFDVDTQQYADLSQCYHHVTAKIVKSDGGDLANPDPVTDDEKVAFVNNIASSIFENCELSLNGKVIESTNNLYAYKSFFQTFLSTGKDIKENQLSVSGYYADTGAIDSDNILDNMEKGTCTNKGLHRRYRKSKGSKNVSLLSPVFLDMCGQKRYIQNGTNIKIKFTRANNQFALMAKVPDKNFKFVITGAYLYVRMVKPARSLRLAVEENLEVAPVKYPLKTYEMRYYTCSGNSTNLVEPSLYSGSLPTRVVFALVKTAALDGTYKTSPFKFDHYKVTDVTLKNNGCCVTNDPLRIDMGSDDYILPFFWMFKSTGGLFTNNEPVTDFEEYKNGHFIYSFDLMQDNEEGSDSFHQPGEGLLSLDMRFAEAPGHPISLVSMFEKETIIECDRERNYRIKN